MSKNSEPFDPAAMAETYRHLYALWESTTDRAAKAQYQLWMKTLRERWATWNRSDKSELHETAMGGG